MGIYAKLYDTDNDGIGDTLVLNNVSNFTYNGDLVSNYNNEDQIDKDGETPASSVSWSSDKSTLIKVVILNEISPKFCNNWFSSASNLVEIEDIENIDTRNVTNMQEMFSRCSNLTFLDLSSFNTEKVTNTQSMFQNCSNLVTIYASNYFINSNITDSFAMFTNCNALVGGNGTTYNSSFVDKVYARIDAVGTPGYFTYKKQREKVWIYDSNLTNIANSIRNKNGTQNTYKPKEMSIAIDNIPSGGSYEDAEEVYY